MTDTAKDMPELKPTAWRVTDKRGRPHYFDNEDAAILARMGGHPVEPLYSEIALSVYKTRADLSRPQAPAEGAVAEAIAYWKPRLMEIKEGRGHLKDLIQAATRSSKDGAQGLAASARYLLSFRDAPKAWESLEKSLAEYRKQTGEA